MFFINIYGFWFNNQIFSFFAAHTHAHIQRHLHCGQLFNVLCRFLCCRENWILILNFVAPIRLRFEKCCRRHFPCSTFFSNWFSHRSNDAFANVFELFAREFAVELNASVNVGVAQRLVCCLSRSRSRCQQ